MKVNAKTLFEKAYGNFCIPVEKKQYLLNVDSNQLIEINEKISDELSVFEKIINFFYN